ncbi:MAG: SDR family NAD(P)-dependent oxidoreductase [Bryobacteraceae bacterium]
MNFPQMFSLAGKTALVAGASRGIGLAIAQGLAAAGAETTLAARSLEALEQEAASLRAKGLKARSLRLDFTDHASIEAAASAVEHVDILVNVAGTNVRKPFEEYSPEEYEYILDTNLNGIVRLTQLIGKGMIGRKSGGKIITIGSLTSVLGLSYISVYGVTKSAVAGLTRGLAAEWGRYNIQVNCIAPGFILTDLNRGMWQDPVMKNWLHGSQPNPRMGSPEDIAPLAVFLSSAGADYITGQVILVDGGFSTTRNWPFQP